MLKALQEMLRVADDHAKALQADLTKYNGTSMADTYATALLVALNIRDILHAGVNATIDDEVETSIEEYRREHGFNPEDLKGLPVYKPQERYGAPGIGKTALAREMTLEEAQAVLDRARKGRS